MTIALLITLTTIALINTFQLTKLRRHMDTIEIILQKIDAATTAAGERVAALITSITADKGTLTEAQQAEADAIVAHLTGILADPAAPVPPPSGVSGS